MTLKQFIIKTCDYLLYFGFALICLFSAIMGATAGPIYGAGVGVVGLILFSMLSGFWFAVSEIASNSQRQVILQERQLKSIEKLNHNLEAHNNNQFADV